MTPAEETSLFERLNALESDKKMYLQRFESFRVVINRMHKKIVFLETGAAAKPSKKEDDYMDGLMEMLGIKK